MALSILSFTALLIAAIDLAHLGTYGWTLFVMLPLLAGALGVWSLRPQTVRNAANIGATVGALGCALFLLLGREGFICLLLALPIVAPLTIAGSLLAYWGFTLSKPKNPIAMCLLIPVSMFFDVTAEPPIYSVSTQIVVNATPERVWKYIVEFPDIEAQPDWVLRTGLAYPVRTRITGTGVGAPRYCDLSTGTVRERVVVWDEPRLLRFVVTETPPGDARNRPLWTDQSQTFEWLLHLESGPIHIDSSRSWSHIDRGHFLVSTWPVACRILAVVVRCRGPSHSSTGFRACSTVVRKQRIIGRKP